MIPNFDLKKQRRQKRAEIIAIISFTIVMTILAVIVAKSALNQPYSVWRECDTGNPILCTYYPVTILSVEDGKININRNDGCIYSCRVNGDDFSVGETVWAGFYGDQIIDIK